MISFRYDAVGAEGTPQSGLIEAPDRRSALLQLQRRGLHASLLQAQESPQAALQAKRSSQVQDDPRSHQAYGKNSKNGAARSPLKQPRSGTSADPSSPRVPLAGSAEASSQQTQDRVAPSPSTPLAETSERHPKPERAKDDSKAAPFAGRIPRKEITAFTRQMASLLRATIPIPAALSGLAEQEQNVSLRSVLSELSASVRMGESFSESLKRYPRLFSTLYVAMIEVGEESGRLDQVLEDMAQLMESQDEMRSEVVSAIAYPCFVLAMGLATTFVLLTFVMPRLFQMLSDMVDVLPLPTRILLATSGFLQAYWPVLLGLTVIVAWGLRSYLRTPSGGYLWDGWKLRVPVLGSLLRAASLSRFARTLGTLENSGVSLLPALEIVKNTVGNRVVTDAIAHVAEETRGGSSLAAPLKALNLFPPTMIQMISVGEETGQLDAMLLRVAEIQEKHVRRSAQTLVSLLAPILILVVGALVGFIVISMLLPIFSMSQGLK